MISNHFKQRAAFDLVKTNAIQSASGGVRQDYAFAIINRNDALNHATQNRSLPGGRLSKLCRVLSQGLANAIQRASQRAKLISPGNINTPIVLPSSDCARRSVKRSNRSSDTADQKVRNENSTKRHKGDCQPNPFHH